LNLIVEILFFSFLVCVADAVAFLRGRVVIAAAS
jgi:hypothetical protein